MPAPADDARRLRTLDLDALVQQLDARGLKTLYALGPLLGFECVRLSRLTPQLDSTVRKLHAWAVGGYGAWVFDSEMESAAGRKNALTRFLAIHPHDDPNPIPDALYLYRAASTRHAIASGSGLVHLSSLGHLAGLQSPRMRQLGQERVITVSQTGTRGSGLVTAAEALRWLRTREGVGRLDPIDPANP